MHHRHDVKMAIEDTWPKEKSQNGGEVEEHLRNS